MNSQTSSGTMRVFTHTPASVDTRLRILLFFEYGEYFNIPAPDLLIRIAFFLPFKNYTKRKTTLRRRVWRKFYKWYTSIVMSIHRDTLISYVSADNKPFYLSPTNESTGKLKELEQAEKKHIPRWVAF